MREPLLPLMRVRVSLAGVRLELDVPLVHVLAGTLGAAAIVAASSLNRRSRPVEPEPVPELDG